jgi:lysozyme
VINKGVSAEAMRRDIRIWLEAITQHYGVKPIIYTNQNYYRKWLQGHFQEYHFWIARYNTIEPEIHQTDKWLFWQYSDRGTIPGITAAVDMNFFAGDWDTLHALCMPELMASDDTALPWQEQMPPLQ